MTVRFASKVAARRRRREERDLLADVGPCSACGETAELKRAPGIAHERYCAPCHVEAVAEQEALEDEACEECGGGNCRRCVGGPRWI